MWLEVELWSAVKVSAGAEPASVCLSSVSDVMKRCEARLRRLLPRSERRVCRGLRKLANQAERLPPIQRQGIIIA